MIVGSKKSKVQYWLEPEQVSDEIYVHSRSFFSKYENSTFKDDSELEDLIYQEHIYISKEELQEIIRATLKAFDFNPSGVGLELGAGCAAVSIEIAKEFPSVSRVYAVEIVPDIVEIAQTSLIRIAGLEGKVIPVLGDFDNLRIENESIDWIIEFDSLHHSFDLAKTARESFRVLKPGGKLIAIDRAHLTTSRQRMKSLEMEPYSREFLLQRGYDPNTRITRADNGEHEHRISDYTRYFKSAGFSKARWKNLLAPELNLLKLALISATPWKLRQATKFRYVQTWPLWKILIPVLILRFSKSGQFGRFIKLPRAVNSKRFQSKTILEFTK